MQRLHTLSGPSQEFVNSGSPVAPSFQLYNRTHPGRARVEACIAGRFQQTYQADIHNFSPLLLAMALPEQCLAAVGIRRAGGQPLFLETYLDMPVEQAIAAAVRRPVDRHRIVEVGNLVAVKPGSSLLLFVVLAAALEQTGCRWLVFTATAEVSRLIGRLGVRAEQLAPATAERLMTGREDWGHYYQHNPQVMALDLAPAMTIARQSPRLGAVIQSSGVAIESLTGSLYRYGDWLDRGAGCDDRFS